MIIEIACSLFRIDHYDNSKDKGKVIPVQPVEAFMGARG
jgi:hypothetical protein